MADQPPYPGIPRWVKVSGIIVIVLIVLVVVLLVIGLGSDHGPGRHSASSEPAQGRAEMMAKDQLNRIRMPRDVAKQLTWSFDNDADALAYGRDEQCHSQAGMQGQIMTG
jgi:hypothetical protein